MVTIQQKITGQRNIGSAEVGRQPPLTWTDWVELQRIVDLKEAARLSGLSIDTIKRRHPDKIIALSPRRRGMRVGIALSLCV
jgi:hypothetical protein